MIFSNRADLSSDVPTPRSDCSPEYAAGDKCRGARARQTGYVRGVKASMAMAFVLLAWDGILLGSFGLSLLVCPIWFLASVLKNAFQRPCWRLALVRIAMPVLTLGLVLANSALQSRIAEKNAARVAAACEEFHAANGTFPQTLDDLTPRYMPSVPRAKYCLALGEFSYWNVDRYPLLLWHVVPPYDRKVYDFEKRRWSSLD